MSAERNSGPLDTPGWVRALDLHDAAHCILVWDGRRARFVWANAAGLKRWGALNLETFRRTHLDRAMPALGRLDALASEALPPEGVRETLVFWTPRGALRETWVCRPVDLGRNHSGLVLEADGGVEDVLTDPAEDYDVFADDGGGGRVVPLRPVDLSVASGGPVSPAWRTGARDQSARALREGDTALPEPSRDDHDAMREIARMLRGGAPGEPPDNSTIDALPERVAQDHRAGREGRREGGSEVGSEAGPGALPARTLSKSAGLSGRSAQELNDLHHELRTPLNSIIGFTEMMHTEQLGPVGNPRYREYLGDILDSARHALSLINDLLDAARVRSGHIALHSERIEPAELLRRSLRTMQPQAEQAGVELIAGFSHNLKPLQADPRALRQILLNILSNAVKFTRSGGRVFVSAKNEADGGLLIAIRDTGVGMSEEELKQAMQRFGQIDGQQPADDAQRGTGLGLPLVQRLVELQGASLDITSAPGAGTRVEIRFPPE